MALVALKLAFAGVARRRLQAALTAVVVAAAAATLTVATGVRDVAGEPWERTWAATRGADAIAMPLSRSAEAAAELNALAQRADVVAATRSHSAFATFELEGRRFGVRLAAVPVAAAVDRPLLQEGDASGAVLERSFARALGIDVGDTLELAGGARLRVTGLALTTVVAPFPASQPGIAFVDERTLARVAPDRATWLPSLSLRLREGVSVEALQSPGVQLDTREELRAEALAATGPGVRTVQVVLGVFGVLLVAAAAFVLATLVGGRVLAQRRELATLKAVGLAPRHLVGVVVVEQAGLAAVGGLLGVAAGIALTPRLVAESAAMLATPAAAPSDPVVAAAIVAGVVAAGALSAALTAWRAARGPAAALLAEPSDRARAGAARGPLVLALGTGFALARPGRSAVAVAAVAVAVACATATLGMEASLRTEAVPARHPGIDWELVPQSDEGLRPLVLALDALLLAVCGANLLAALLLALRERRRDLAILKAVGVTPRGVAATFLSTQGAIAALATAIGIPLGLALFRLAIAASGSDGDFAYPPVSWLLALAPAAVLAVVLLAAPLGRRAGRIPVAEALRAD